MLLVSPLINKAGVECMFHMYMYRLFSLFSPVLQRNSLPFHSRHIQEEEKIKNKKHPNSKEQNKQKHKATNNNNTNTNEVSEMNILITNSFYVRLVVDQIDVCDVIYVRFGPY